MVVKRKERKGDYCTDLHNYLLTFSSKSTVMRDRGSAWQCWIISYQLKLKPFLSYQLIMPDLP